MATITKIINTAIPSTKRYQYWSSAELNDDLVAITSGDIFMIEKSIGKPAKNVIVATSAGCNLEVRFNTQYDWTVRHTSLDDTSVNTIEGSFYENLASTVTKTDTSMTPIAVGSAAAATLSLDGGLAVSDIQIAAWSIGTFTILVT